MLATLPLPSTATLNVGFGAAAPGTAASVAIVSPTEPPSALVAATAATAATLTTTQAFVRAVSDRTIRISFSSVEVQNCRQAARLRKNPWPLLLRQVRPVTADAQLSPPPLHVLP